jgi:hypothetical protein
MNASKVSSIYRQILNASHVYSVNDGEYVNVCFADLNGDPNNEVIHVRWEDEVGNEYVRIVTEEGLDIANVNGNDLVLVDQDGDLFPIRLYLLERVNIKVEWDASLDEPLNTDEIGS